MNYRNVIALTAATVLTFGSGMALAQNGNNASNSMMSICEVTQTLKDNGYKSIDSIDHEMDRYEVDATDSNGQRVELVVDGHSGEVLHSKHDSD